MTTAETIEFLMKEYGYTSYLEIGNGERDVFMNITTRQKEMFDYTQEKTFNNMGKTYDVVYINRTDGELILNDIYQICETWLNENGVIIFEHCIPGNDECGDVYKILPVLHENGFTFNVVNSCGGICVIWGNHSNLDLNRTPQLSDMSFTDVFNSDYPYEKYFNMINKVRFYVNVRTRKIDFGHSHINTTEETDSKNKKE